MDEHEVNAAAAAGKSGDEERPVSLEERRREFGEKLRATRLGLGRSDKDVIHLTRIAPPFITALEEGRFEDLPGQVFGRGFVKNICKALDVDSGGLLVDYDSCWDTKAPKAKSYNSYMMKGKRPTKSRLRAERSGGGFKFVNYFSMKAVALWVGLPVAIMASLVALMIKLPDFGKRSPLASKGAPAEVERGAEPESGMLAAGQLQGERDQASGSEADRVAPAAESLEGEAPAAVGSLAPEPPTPPAVARKASKEAPLTLLNAQPEQSRLVIRVREKVDIKYKFDDQPPETQQHEAGDYEFAFKEKADIYVFDIAKVELEFNGRKLSWYGPQMGEKRLSFVGRDAKQGEL